MPTSTRMTPDDSWAEYRRLVISELERLNKEFTNNQNNTSLSHQSIQQTISDLKQQLIDKMHYAITESESRHATNNKEIHARLSALENDVVTIRTQSTTACTIVAFVVTVIGVVINIFIK